MLSSGREGWYYMKMSASQQVNNGSKCVKTCWQSIKMECLVYTIQVITEYATEFQANWSIDTNAQQTVNTIGNKELAAIWLVTYNDFQQKSDSDLLHTTRDPSIWHEYNDFIPKRQHQNELSNIIHIIQNYSNTSGSTDITSNKMLLFILINKWMNISRHYTKWLTALEQQTQKNNPVTTVFTTIAQFVKHSMFFSSTNNQCPQKTRHTHIT